MLGLGSFMFVGFNVRGKGEEGGERECFICWSCWHAAWSGWDMGLLLLLRRSWVLLNTELRSGEAGYGTFQLAFARRKVSSGSKLFALSRAE